MCSKPQIHRKPTSRPNFAIIPPTFDVKNMPNLTPPSELVENLHLQFQNYKTSSNNWDLTLVTPFILLVRGTPKRNEKQPCTHKLRRCSK